MARAALDLTGMTFTYLRVMSRSVRGKTEYGHHEWECLCTNCGCNTVATASYLVRGRMKSCGCMNGQFTRDRLRTEPYLAIFNRLKSSATKRGIAVNISHAEYREIAETTGNCHYCCASLGWIKYRAVGSSSGHNIDRKDSSRGYVLDNVVACCGRCNRGKSDQYSYEEWWRMTQGFRDDYEQQKSNERTDCLTSTVSLIASAV